MKSYKTNPYIPVLTISTCIIATFLIINLFTFSSDLSSNVEKESLSFNDDYSIYSLDIPDNLTFAGEVVPIEKHWVKESLDRELLINTYWQSQTILFIKRCHRFFPVIEPILQEEDVPDDFKYLAVIESGLMPRSVSPAGASGIWQFMTATGKEYGLEINAEVDERYHIQKSTIAACKFFKKSFEKYQNWTLAAASYNAGKQGVSEQLERQKTDNYYDLLLGEETGRYVYRIIALKEILSQPQKYGFHVKEEDLYPAILTQTVMIDSAVSNFADFASLYGLTYKEFKELNPWLRDISLSNGVKKTYFVDVPKNITSSRPQKVNMQEISPALPKSNTEIKLKKQSLIVR